MDKTSDKTSFITARQFRNIQRRINRLLTLPMETFEQIPEGWSKYPIDPLPVNDCLKHIYLKNDFVLRAYQFKRGGNGNGFVYAIPADADFPDPEEYLKTKGGDNNLKFEAPRPPQSLSSFMQAFAGDQSPRSFFEASVMLRELDELGAMWHGLSWSTHTVLDTDPFALRGKTKRRTCREINTPAEKWTWTSSKPGDWRPQVVLRDNSSVVRFYSYSGLDQEGIYVSTDMYSMENYVPECSVDMIAHGSGGYIF